jgi:hypothetical protein
MSKTIDDPARAPAHEVRTLRSELAEFRAEVSGDSVKVSGYASVFNEIADIGGYFREVVRPGAFTAALERGDDAQFLIGHRDLPLARVASGTLRLTQDDKGLRMETELDASDPDVARIVPKMKRGDLTKMSFGFTIRPDGEQRWVDKGDEETELREIISVGRLYDVSIVPEPAYAGTDIALRSLEAFRAERGDAPAVQALEARALWRKNQLGLMARQIGKRSRDR